MGDCQHRRLAHWTSCNYRANTHTGKCHACGIDFGPFATWEEVRIAAGRKPSIAKKPVSERAILEAAAERFCSKCMDCTIEEVEDEKPTCRKLKAILEPITKEKS